MPQRTAVPACPPWCALPTGHPFFPPLLAGDEPYRFHERRLSTSPDGRLVVVIEAFESRERGWHVHLDRAEVELLEYSLDAAVPSGTNLTVGEARWMAGQLVAAADRIEARR